MRFDIATGAFFENDKAADRPAIEDGRRVVTWREFESEVFEWVERARRRGVARDVPVMIYGHKEAEYLIAMAGCLMMGAPFVPTDVMYPNDRIEKIKELCGAPVLYLAAKNDFAEIGALERKQVAESNLAYIIFTSGSTGEPKGVQIGRESVTSLVQWIRDDFDLGPAPIFMNQAPFSFDLSMYEVMATLAFGGCCVLNSRDALADPEVFLERQRRARVTTWVSTPSFVFQQFLSRSFNSEYLPTLKTFLFCGEVLPNSVAGRLRKQFPSSKIINTYGPTEATVATTSIVIDDNALERFNPLPVGYAKRHSHVFLEPSTGEICIAGDNVMRGYLNGVDLNSSKLFEFNGMRAFRTGDIGEIDENGLIFCRGRFDDQIKLNGFRIELSEIDNALERIEGVSRAATIALRRHDESVSRLVAFVVTESKLDDADKMKFLSQCKSQLADYVPVYMIPSELFRIEEIPLSMNKKVDRKKLMESYRHNATGLASARTMPDRHLADGSV